MVDLKLNFWDNHFFFCLYCNLSIYIMLKYSTFNIDFTATLPTNKIMLTKGYYTIPWTQISYRHQTNNKKGKNKYDNK
jgi:hypothetical protein